MLKGQTVEVTVHYRNKKTTADAVILNDKGTVYVSIQFHGEWDHDGKAYFEHQGGRYDLPKTHKTRYLPGDFITYSV